MTLFGAYLHGIYPRSEELVAATRDLDRGRTTPEAVAERRTQDLAELVQAQQEAGLDFFSDGLLAWQDPFRPLVKATPGLTTGALVRWFDNNTFYRAPEVEKDLGAARDFDPLAAHDVPSPRVATLPSPYLFSQVTVTNGSRSDLMEDLATHVLRPAAEQLVTAGAGLVQLQEPWLAFHGIHEEAWGPFIEAVHAVTDGLGVTTVLHTYFGDAAPYAARLQELPVDVLGFDFTETDVEALGAGWSKDVLAGCVDGRRSVLEPVDDVVAFAEHVADVLRAPTVYVSSNCDLEYLSRDLGAEKVRRLGEAARRLKESVKETVG
jgi:5-methyltetrahydropteroyltriglutamate--homocysteine methyltransferase